MKVKLIVVLTVALVLALSGRAVALDTRANVYRFPDASQVTAAYSIVATSEQGARMTLHTSDLPAGHAVTVWWVVFNETQNCTHPVPALGLKCSAGDLPPYRRGRLGGDLGAVRGGSRGRRVGAGGVLGPARHR